MTLFSRLLVSSIETDNLEIVTFEKCSLTKALMFSLICAWTNGKANNRDASALSRHRAHYDVTVIKKYPRQVSIIYMISYSSKSLLICEIYVIHINERSYHVGFRGFPFHEGFSEERDIKKKVEKKWHCPDFFKQEQNHLTKFRGPRDPLNHIQLILTIDLGGTSMG